MKNKKSTNIKYNDYTIAIDWLQFIATSTNINNLKDKLNTNIINGFKAEIDHNNNPNFRFNYKIKTINNLYIANIFISSTNKSFNTNDVLIKVNNYYLYRDDLIQTLENLLEVFKLSFQKINRLDIALDGNRNIKIIQLLTKISKGHKTIMLGNEAVKLSSNDADYGKGNYATYYLGSTKSPKMAVIYNKSTEIKSSGKKYIIDYWQRNNLNVTNDIIRFELRLKSSVLRNYDINLSNVNDVNYLISLFKQEVINWLKIYKVYRTDYIKYHNGEKSKQNVIKNGYEIYYIMWNRLPETTKLLKETHTIIENKTKYKHAIDVNLELIKTNIFIISSNQTIQNLLSQIKIITYSKTLEYYTIKKIEKLFLSSNISDIKRKIYNEVYDLYTELLMSTNDNKQIS